MTEKAKARRGDLVIVHTRSSSWVNDSPGRGHTQASEEFAVGVVTSVTRDGHVKLWREAGQLDDQRDHLGRPDRGRGLPTVGFQQSWIVPASQIDVPDAVASAVVHTWDGHSTQVKAFGSLDEVRAALRPHLRQSPGWEALHAAGVARIEAQRAAWAHYLATRTSAWQDPGFGVYEASVAAANDIYRAALGRVPQSAHADRGVPGRDPDHPLRRDVARPLNGGGRPREAGLVHDVQRDTDGTILRGPCLPCGCPLDSGCTGHHPGRLP